MATENRSRQGPSQRIDIELELRKLYSQEISAQMTLGDTIRTLQVKMESLKQMNGTQAHLCTDFRKDYV